MAESRFTHSASCVPAARATGIVQSATRSAQPMRATFSVRFVCATHHVQRTVSPVRLAANNLQPKVHSCRLVIALCIALLAANSPRRAVRSPWFAVCHCSVPLCICCFQIDTRSAARCKQVAVPGADIDSVQRTPCNSQLSRVARKPQRAATAYGWRVAACGWQHTARGVLRTLLSVVRHREGVCPTPSQQPPTREPRGKGGRSLNCPGLAARPWRHPGVWHPASITPSRSGRTCAARRQRRCDREGSRRAGLVIVDSTRTPPSRSCRFDSSHSPPRDRAHVGQGWPSVILACAVLAAWLEELGARRLGS